MNKLLLTTLLLMAGSVKAQITVDSSDFATANETIIYSNASPLTSGIDLTQTGPNYTWNFSQLVPTTQGADTFVSVTSTGTIYSLFFINLAFNPYRSNIAIRGTFPAIPGVSLSDVYNFYFKSNTGYRQTGVGGTLNGQEVPVAYSDQDAVYLFPMNYGNQDTSLSNFSVSVPNLGSYVGTQTRINNVDGWGSLTTPYGTFNCLRMVSQLTGHDSVHVDSLNFGIGFDRTLTREYKWIAKGQDVPVLQINTQELLPGNETIASIKYRDSIQVVSVKENVNSGIISVYPNPASDYIIVKCAKAFSSDGILELYTSNGQLVKRVATGIKDEIWIETEGLAAGMYQIKLIDEGGSSISGILIQR